MDEAASWVVTPTLFLGEPPPWSDVLTVGTLAEALSVINSGHTAVLPSGAWNLAAEVLEGLGLSEETARKRLANARPCSFR